MKKFTLIAIIGLSLRVLVQFGFLYSNFESINSDLSYNILFGFHVPPFYVTLIFLTTEISLLLFFIGFYIKQKVEK